MTLICEFRRWLFVPPQIPISPFRAMIWWESRRLPFNLIVGFVLAIGLFSYDAIVEVYPPFTEAGLEYEVAVQLAMVLFVGVNVVYVLAWMVEGFIRFWVQNRWESFGPKLMCGLILLIWTAFPGICWWHYHETLRLNIQVST